MINKELIKDIKINTGINLLLKIPDFDYYNLYDTDPILSFYFFNLTESVVKNIENFYIIIKPKKTILCYNSNSNSKIKKLNQQSNLGSFVIAIMIRDNNKHYWEFNIKDRFDSNIRYHNYVFGSNDKKFDKYFGCKYLDALSEYCLKNGNILKK